MFKIGDYVKVRSKWIDFIETEFSGKIIFIDENFIILKNPLDNYSDGERDFRREKYIFEETSFEEMKREQIKDLEEDLKSLQDDLIITNEHIASLEEKILQIKNFQE